MRCRILLLVIGVFWTTFPVGLRADTISTSTQLQRLLEGHAKYVPVGKAFSSPEGRLSVSLETVSDNYDTGTPFRYVIYDNGTSKPLASLPMETILYRVDWVDHGQSICSVVQMAHGSFAQLIHRRNSEWTITDIIPEIEELKACEVIDVKLSSNPLTITFKASEQASPHSPSRHYLITFEVDPKTGTKLTENSKPITLDEYIALKPSWKK